jgi:fumarylacetoacetate (FAA) hydrolase
MKLATIKDGTRDGKLVMVSRDLKIAAHASAIASNLRSALENWRTTESRLRVLYDDLNSGRMRDTFAFDVATAAAPLPRSAQWLDGSTFLNHARLMARALGHPPIDEVNGPPLVYQGASDDFLGPQDDAGFFSEEDGIDFEAEIAIVTDDVPMGIHGPDAVPHVKLVMLANDFSLRFLQPREMKTGFGFLQSKSWTSFTPVAVTPDELGDAWRNGRVHLPVRVEWNGKWFGNPNGGEMSFSFFELMEHVARTRNLRASTIIGSGTVSNADRKAGSGCISELRAIETIDAGRTKTAFMHFGDRIRIESLDRSGASIFGAINQRVIEATRHVVSNAR